ncbi:MAG: glycosyltransferase [Chloroflexi bacterium]|nr:glycosyltransferase [Chloroflexota bacterium]
MKILFCSRWFPYPPDNGSRIRVFNLIKHLSSRHEIDLVSFTSKPLSNEHLNAMRHYCQRVDVIPYRLFQPGRLKALLGFLSTQPRSVVDTYSPEMYNLIQEAKRRSQFDLAIAELDTAPYLLVLPNTPKLLDELQLTVLYENFTRQTQPLRRLRHWLTWWKLSRYITQLLSNYNGCLVASEQERNRVQAVAPPTCSVGVIPNGVDTNFYTANDFIKPEPDTLVYSGALTFNANFDAMHFFLQEIFPLIRAKRPNVKLFITGKLDGVPIDRLPDTDGVVFTGYLDDIRPKIAQSWVSIVPLQIGGGTRLKILESLALGTPVVATSKGAEGLDLAPGHDLLIADDPADFAAAVLRLLQDAKLRETLNNNGRLAIKKYDWHTIGQDFCDFVEKIAVRGQSV